MNYITIYENLIKRAKSRITSAYTEKHHIIPRCMGGSDSTENIVHLTPEEHYVAHQLLVKIHPTNQSLIYAANMMCSANDTHRQDGQGRNNKLYGWLKRRLSLAAHQRTGSKNGSYGKYWYHNPISNEAGKFLPGAEPAGWCIGRVPLRKCITCGSQASSKNAKYCQTCEVIFLGLIATNITEIKKIR